MEKFFRQTGRIKKPYKVYNNINFHEVTLLGLLIAITLLTPAYADITLSEVGSLANPASDLASNIMGEGITINSAVYQGGNSQTGIFTSGAGLSFGSDVLGFTDGIVFSTGRANTVEGPNSANAGVNAIGGISGDADFDSLAGVDTHNASWLEIDFTPELIPNTSVGDIGRITMNIVFGSEEYNAFVYGGVNDAMAIIVNGKNKAIVPNGLDYGIDTINDAATYNPFNGDVINDPNPGHVSANFESANPSLYKNNMDNRFNTQMNGFTITIPVTFDIKMGESNKIKIGIADANDFRSDSWLFVKEDSGQTVIVAENDTVTTPTNAPYNIDVLANDYDRQGDPLTVIRIDDQAINTGQTIVLPSGVSIKLEADGTLTIKGDGINPTHDLFTYEMTDGNGSSSIAFVDVTITDADTTPPEPTIVVDSITSDNIINLTESTASIEVTGTIGGEFSEGDTVTLTVNGTDYTGTTDAAGKYSIAIPGSELQSDTTIDAKIDTTDSAGNNGDATIAHDHGIDIEPPVPTIVVNAITADNVINISESSADIDVTGTVGGDFVAGNNVTLTINGNQYNGLVDDNGLYSISVLGLDLVVDLEIDASTTTSDIAGNTGLANTTHTHTLDITAPIPTITVNDITADNIINITESTANINVRGVVGGDFSTGDTVTLNINGKSFTGPVDNSGNYSIAVPGSDLVADLGIEASILATEDAGNTATTNTTHTHTLDMTAPTLALSVNDITADNTINDSESKSNVTVTGGVTGEFISGDIVTLTINGNTYSGSVDDGGVYSIIVSGSDLAADLLIDAKVTTTDSADNANTVEITHSHLLDATAPEPSIVVNNITADNIINEQESNENVNVTGTVAGDFATGDQVTLTINGKAYNGVVDTVGNYSMIVPGIELVADLVLEASVSTTDNAGNTNTGEATHTHTVDTTLPVPILSVNNITADNIINESESNSEVNITGAVTGDFSSGDIVTLLIKANSYAGSVDDGGNYLITVAGSDLASDLEIEASVVTTDSAGNTGSATTTHSHTLDTTAPIPTITVNDITADNIVNVTESITNINVTGVVGDFATGDQVTLTINGKTYNGVVDTVGNYSVIVPGIELVADLLIDASISTTDNAGNTNTGEATHTHAVDTTLPVPILSVNDITADNIINESESNSEVNITGAVTGDFSSGDIVTLLIKANSYAGSVDEVGNYLITVAGSDLASDLEIEASVVTTDSAGNTGSATTTHIHSIDTNLPNIPTVDILITEESTPILSGTATMELGDVLTISVGGATYIIEQDSNNNGNSDWSLNTALVTPNSGTFVPNVDGVANDVNAITTDSTGNSSPDLSSGELTIDSLKAADDSGNAFNRDDSAIVNVLANDTLEGNLAVIQDLTLTQNSTALDTILLDITTGLVSVEAGTPEGTYTLEYKVCEKSKPTNCETATATVSVVGDLDGDGVSDGFDLDMDNDGIPDTLEQLTAQNGGDTDSDGIPDEQDLDADGDGIGDLMESGITAALIARLDDNKDGVIDSAVGDNGLANALETDDTQTARLTNGPANTDGTKEPDFQDLDSDNDSIHDLIEGSGFDPLLVDINNNGVLDAIDLDADNDGIADSVDKNINRFGGLYKDFADFDSDGIPDYQDLDSDGDGIYDVFEANVVDVALVDVNANGLLDGSNVDSDFDGVLDSGDTDDVNYGDPQATLPLDMDQDGSPDFLDLDSDNDSIPDTTEAGNQDDNNDGLLDPNGVINLTPPDTDNDGVEDFRDVDSDGDSVNDIEATDFAETDSDNDGRADDTTDDDNDGIPNVIDAEPGLYGTGTDLDQDGIPSSIDLDDDNDGLPDLAELDASGKDIDTDGDGIVDRLDRDSDNDGLPDALEAVAGTNPDVNGDGVIDDFVDDNGDGLHDRVDPALTAVDTESDGIPDFRDLDTDNDTFYDLYEASLGTGADADADGRLGVLTDVDRDGLADVVDTQVTDTLSGVAFVNPDTDGDGIYDFRDNDSDNDGIPDIDESGDGFNNPLDENNNNIDDYIEAVAANPNNLNGTLETAVAGVGGSLNILGIFFLLGLLGLKKYGSFSGQKESVALLVSAAVLLGLMNRASASDCSWDSSNSLESAFKPCFYAGGGVVSSSVDPERGTNGWGTSDSSSSGYNLFVGYHFKPNLFAEFGYMDLGEATLKNSFDATAKESLSYKVPSLHIGYLQQTPIKQVSVYGKAGVSAIQNKVSSSRVSYEKQTSAQLSFGLGAQWQGANSPFFARLGADFHDRDAAATHLNIGYKFAAKRATPVAKPIPAALPIIRTKPRPAPVRRRPVDTDGDGYPDNLDHCPLSKRGMPVDRRGCEINLPKKPTFSGVLEGVNFQTGSAVLTPTANNILRNVARQFKRWPDLHVIIVGHTDNVGTDHSNMKLSLQRAKRVTIFLMEHGVKRSSIVSFKGKGEREPRATNKSQAGKAKNRRVELLPQ